MPHQNFCFIFMFVYKNKTHSQQSSLLNGVFVTQNFLRTLTAKCCLSHAFFFCFLLVYFKVTLPHLELPPGCNFLRISCFFKRNTTFIKYPDFSKIYFSSPLMPLQSLLERLWIYHPLSHIVHKSPISGSTFHLDMCLIMSVLTILP